MISRREFLESLALVAGAVAVPPILGAPLPDLKPLPQTVASIHNKIRWKLPDGSVIECSSLGRYGDGSPFAFDCKILRDGSRIWREVDSIRVDKDLSIRATRVEIWWREEGSHYTLVLNDTDSAAEDRGRDAPPFGWIEIAS